MSYYQTIRDTQKAARKVAREVGKPASEKRAKNPAGKGRKRTDAYAWWIDPRTKWKYYLCKSWQNDNSKEYARWFMFVEGYCSEYGDEYCCNVRPALRDAMAYAGMSSDGSYGGLGTTWWFDDSVWSTAGEFSAWAWGER